MREALVTLDSPANHIATYTNLVRAANKDRPRLIGLNTTYSAAGRIIIAMP